MFGSFTLHPMWRKNIQHLCEVDLLRFLMISDECHIYISIFRAILSIFGGGSLFLSEAGDSIHSLSSCKHIGALKTECKYKISLKSAYLYSPKLYSGEAGGHMQ